MNVMVVAPLVFAVGVLAGLAAARTSRPAGRHSLPRKYWQSLTGQRRRPAPDIPAVAAAAPQAGVWRNRTLSTVDDATAMVRAVTPRGGAR